jgi:hypothetical protein
MRETIKKYTKILTGKSHVQRTLRRLKHRWENNIKWILQSQGVKMWTEFNYLKMGPK